MPRWLDAQRLRSVELDRRAAVALHQGVERVLWRRACAVASRLSDAPAWLALIAVLPWFGGPSGAVCARQMLVLGGLDLVLYWALKHGTRRERPARGGFGVRERLPAPDAFSFPSGHALHAAAFATVLSVHYPALSPVLAAFAALVAVSRVVLGLHYPSDVLMGALIGIATAQAVLGGWGP